MLTLRYLALSQGGAVQWSTMLLAVLIVTFLLAATVGWVDACLWASLAAIPFGLPLGYDRTSYWLAPNRRRWLGANLFLNALGTLTSFALCGMLIGSSNDLEVKVSTYVLSIIGLWLLFTSLRLLCESQLGQSSRALIFLPIGLLIIQSVNPTLIKFLFTPLVGLGSGLLGICLIIVSVVYSNIERMISRSSV